LRAAVYRGMLIGRRVKVVFSLNRSLEGLRGTVVDETKNTLVVEREDGKVVKVPKAAVRLEVEGKVVDGTMLLGRFEDRVTKG